MYAACAEELAFVDDDAFAVVEYAVAWVVAAAEVVRAAALVDFALDLTLVVQTEGVAVVDPDQEFQVPVADGEPDAPSPKVKGESG